MEVGRIPEREKERLNSTTPIFSRVIIGGNSRTDHVQHGQSQNMMEVTARLRIQTQENERLKKLMLRLEQRNLQLERQLITSKAESQQHLLQQIKLVRVQDRNNTLIKRLQQQVTAKTVEITQQSSWQRRYNQLSRYMHIYTAQIQAMQEQFKTQYMALTGQIKQAKDEKDLETLNRQKWENSYNQMFIIKTKLEMEISRGHEERAELEKACMELEEENQGLLGNTKAMSEELGKCTELVDKLFTELKEKGAELKEKNDNISYLEKHLDGSVGEIQRLNELVRTAISSDTRAIEEIQRLDARCTDSKDALDAAKADIQQKASKIAVLETQNRAHLQTIQTIKQLTRDLQTKLVTSLASQQALKMTLETKEDKIQQLQEQVKNSRFDKNSRNVENEQRISYFQMQIRRLNALMEESAQNHRREIQSNNKIIQQLSKFKKQSQTKNLLLGSLKEKMKDQKGKEFKLGQFQMRLERYSRTNSKDAEQYDDQDLSPEKPFTKAKTSSRGQPTSDSTKRASDNFAMKANEFDNYQHSLKLRTDLLPPRVPQLSEQEYSN